jgi:hypothetical protein
MKAPQISLSNLTEDAVDILVDSYIVDSPSLEMYKFDWGDATVHPKSSKKIKRLFQVLMQ